MTINEYRDWYQDELFQPAPLTDQQLKAYPYFLNDEYFDCLDPNCGCHAANDHINHDFDQPESKNIDYSEQLQNDPSSLQIDALKKARAFQRGGFFKRVDLQRSAVKESPLSITSGLLFHGGTNHD